MEEHSSNPDDHAENNIGQQQQQKDEGWLLILAESMKKFTVNRTCE